LRPWLEEIIDLLIIDLEHGNLGGEREREREREKERERKREGERERDIRE
jgi:hypothetical protein